MKNEDLCNYFIATIIAITTNFIAIIAIAITINFTKTYAIISYIAMAITINFNAITAILRTRFPLALFRWLPLDRLQLHTLAGVTYHNVVVAAKNHGLSRSRGLY